jgi:hypothetical protein
MPIEKLNAETSGFVLAASITMLANTVLACAKDVYAPFKALMKSIAGHDWTTQGLFDLVLFAVLGLIFTNARIAERMSPSRLIAILIGAVVISALGLVLWYVLT